MSLTEAAYNVSTIVPGGLLDRLRRLWAGFCDRPFGSAKGELWHESFIGHFVAALHPRLSLEIGVAEGRTTRHLSMWSLEVIGIDLDPESPARLRHLRNVRVITSDSVAALQQLRSSRLGQVDFCFIDGDHRAEYAIEDFRNVLPLLAPRAVVVLHDTYPRSADVVSDLNQWSGSAWKLPDMIRSEFPGLDLVTLPIPPGLTFVQRAVRGPAWMVTSSPQRDE